ncbi:SCO4225 family membrane protein [Mobilicoccus pelagius]|uniref:Uncharacterized protein n=1 Tax=Mobilicoccus pelagius NBRC 104925 TaxID=1089455 RepID=H5USS0_9MICO|nr:hypothetical protein [Mobilicoccus pelagius]GAB48778.1 hypothetical protein MOPEL_080_00570 [Mobilicoccus pelagius NBRC 104925]
MTHPLRRAFTPSSHERGRLATIVALVYLAAVAIAAAASFVSLAVADPTHPSFSVGPLLLLTSPTSLVVAEPVAALDALFPTNGAAAPITMIVSFAVAGILQAMALFLLLRGRYVDAAVENGRLTHA